MKKKIPIERRCRRVVEKKIPIERHDGVIQTYHVNSSTRFLREQAKLRKQAKADKKAAMRKKYFKPKRKKNPKICRLNLNVLRPISGDQRIIKPKKKGEAEEWFDEYPE